MDILPVPGSRQGHHRASKPLEHMDNRVRFCCHCCRRVGLSVPMTPFPGVLTAFVTLASITSECQSDIGLLMCQAVNLSFKDRLITFGRPSGGLKITVLRLSLTCMVGICMTFVLRVPKLLPTCRCTWKSKWVRLMVC